MSITTYSELKTAIASWSKRSDLTSQMADFIALAESRISRSLLARVMEVETELTMTANDRYVTLPADFDSPIALWLKANLPREQLAQRLPQDLPVTTSSGYPEWWAIDGTNIAFDKPAEQAWDFDFRYTKSLTLSDSAPTNYILTNYPDVYLFGALVEASQYGLDPQQSAVWEVRFQSAIAEAADAEHANRSGAQLVTEFGAFPGRGRFNITRGY